MATFAASQVLRGTIVLKRGTLVKRDFDQYCAITGDGARYDVI